MMKVGLMGLGKGGQLVAEAILSSSWCELVAVASRQPHRLDRFVEKHPDISAYDDFRSLIVENPLEALFVAVPPFLRPKYLALAAEHRCPVWMLTPVARRFDEAVEILDRFEKAGCPIAVARAWGIETAMQPEAIDVNRLGRFFLAGGNVTICTEEDLDWRGDSVRAGSGVLLDRGYELVDLVVKLMGLPATVYAAARGVSRPGTRFPYDTEDTAVVVCQFAGGGLAVLSACWTAGPQRCEIEFLGTEGSIRIDPQRVVCRDRTGERILSETGRAANPLLASIENFLASLRGAPERMRSSVRDHLATMAVIQAAYLSARTGQPESPGKIFEMHDVKVPPATA